MKVDGVYIKEKKPVVTLVNFGDVPPTLFKEIDHSLKWFFRSHQNELDLFPDINLVNRANPLINHREESESKFKYELRLIPGKIVVGVTNKGIYDTDRYIFGFGWYNKGLLSIYRFINTNKRPQKIRERLAKEIIKILALAIGIPHCQNKQCILTYHYSVVDLDRNTGICDNCREQMIEHINQILKD